MVVKQTSIKERLKELDTILGELSKYNALSRTEIEANLSQRWIIERGLIAAASMILDVADHILAGEFGIYAKAYEESLLALEQNHVISLDLYTQIKGLGGFRNVLVHLYQTIEIDMLFENYHKALKTFPLFSLEILTWLDTKADESSNSRDHS